MTESRARDSSGSAFPDSADSKGISSGMGPFLMGARHG
ncbi:hypothetical protein J2Z78_004505 [Streptomyces griseorubens]